MRSCVRNRLKFTLSLMNNLWSKEIVWLKQLLYELQLKFCSIYQTKLPEDYSVQDVWTNIMIVYIFVSFLKLESLSIFFFFFSVTLVRKDTNADVNADKMIWGVFLAKTEYCSWSQQCANIIWLIRAERYSTRTLTRIEISSKRTNKCSVT